VGVATPVIRDIDTEETTLTVQRVGERDLREAITEQHVRTVARQLATLHEAGFVHGDPTTRNVRINERVTLIDFGLGYYTDDLEDHAMDLHVLFQSLAGTEDNADRLRMAAVDAYGDVGNDAVLDTLSAIETRGRYR
jgi:N6-L-threonylcarbamoyladenine synthase/protein kinase Bud32